MMGDTREVWDSDGGNLGRLGTEGVASQGHGDTREVGDSDGGDLGRLGTEGVASRGHGGHQGGWGQLGTGWWGHCGYWGQRGQSGGDMGTVRLGPVGMLGTTGTEWWGHGDSWGGVATGRLGTLVMGSGDHGCIGDSDNGDMGT